jgi:hypothetical protein
MTDPTEPKPIEIFVDADACPVKEEVYRVARRYGLKVYVVANGSIRVPQEPLIELIVVDQGPDIADDWIADRAEAGDIVITADIPLAHRALQKGAEVIGPTGRAFTTSSIGAALAQRGIMEHLRSTGEITGGPKPFAPADRSRFLSELDQAINRSKRRR